MRRILVLPLSLLLGSAPGDSLLSRLEPFDLVAGSLLFRRAGVIAFHPAIKPAVVGLTAWFTLVAVNEGLSVELLITVGGLALGAIMVSSAATLTAENAKLALSRLRLGLAVSATAAVAVAVVQRIDGQRRPAGLFDNPNELANVALAYASVSLLAAGLSEEIGSSRLHRFLSPGILALALFATQSRSVLLATSLLIGGWISVRILNRPLAFVTVTTFASVSTYLVAFRAPESLDSAPGRILDRDIFYAENWSRGLGGFARSPGVGNGVLGSRVESTSFSFNGLDELHNTPIFLLSSGGIVGLIALAPLAVFVWKCCERAVLSRAGLPVVLALCGKAMFGNQTSARSMWLIVMALAISTVVLSLGNETRSTAPRDSLRTG